MLLEEKKDISYLLENLNKTPTYSKSYLSKPTFKFTDSVKITLLANNTYKEWGLAPIKGCWFPNEREDNKRVP